MKTLKTTLMTVMLVQLAAGQPLHGRFHVAQPGTVLIYVGEGGMIPHNRKLQRICDSLGVKLADRPIHVTYDVAPIGTDRFRTSLERDLHRYEPSVFDLDPLYAYHGAAGGTGTWPRSRRQRPTWASPSGSCNWICRMPG